MDIKTLRTTIDKISSLDPNDDFVLEDCWAKLTRILSENITESIDFILNTCTDEEFFLMSSVFDDVARQTQCKELIPALIKRLSEITPERYEQQRFKTKYIVKQFNYDEFIRCINVDIDYAKNELDD